MTRRRDRRRTARPARRGTYGRPPGGVHRRRRDGRRRHLLAARRGRRGRGSAVWLSFLIAGAIAGLQGYSFAKFGARYPSAGGLLEYVVRGFGDGHVTGIIAWLLLAANAIVTGMVAVSFGSYASSAVADGDAAGSSCSPSLLVARR